MSSAALLSTHYASALDPASIAIGETALTPSARIDFVSIDNTFRTENDVVSTTQFVFSPRLEWVADRRLLELSAVYQGAFAASDENAASYADNSVTASASADFSTRNRSTASFSFARSHVDIGTGLLTDVTGDEADDVAEFNDITLRADHRYGAANATGNIRIGGIFRSRSYSNLSEFTDGRDFTEFGANAQFSYRISSDTRTFIGVRASNFDFDADSLDRTEAGVFTGLEFSATGAISGRIQLGFENVQPDLDTIEDSNILSIETSVVYRPVNFSNFTLDVSREIDNTQGVIDSANNETPITTSGTLAWNHEWTSRISTTTAVNLEIFDTDCPEPDYQTVTPSFAVSYSVRRFLSFGLTASYQNRSTSNCDNTTAADELDDFDRTNVGAFIEASL